MTILKNHTGALHGLHDPARIKALFDEMAATYGVVNLVSSLGFARRWRRQCIRCARPNIGAKILDLMTGMGELVPDLSVLAGAEGRITAVDISTEMCRRARQRNRAFPTGSVEIVESDVFRINLPGNSFDGVYCTFGLKTLSSDQMVQLASRVRELLRPGGVFAFLEISVPPTTALRILYMFYIRRVIPLIGRAFLGNPDCYRMLGVYTTQFRDCSFALKAFEDAGLKARWHSFFFGCATGFSGMKPEH